MSNKHEGNNCVIETWQRNVTSRDSVILFYDDVTEIIKHKLRRQTELKRTHCLESELNKFSFYTRTIKEWNMLPDYIKSALLEMHR